MHKSAYTYIYLQSHEIYAHFITRIEHNGKWEMSIFLKT